MRQSKSAGYFRNGLPFNCLDAKVVSLLGHSRGSIGILTSDGDCFVGDLLENTKQPARNSIIDDRIAAQASVEKLKSLQVKTVSIRGTVNRLSWSNCRVIYDRTFNNIAIFCARVHNGSAVGAASTPISWGTVSTAFSG